MLPGGNPHLLPDVIVEEGPSGGLDVVLTSEYLPRLSMNERYMELMAESSGSRELRQYLRKAFREGQELLRALDMRQETVLRLARAIVRRQEDFFRFGPSRLKAMGMEEVAEEMGVHVSTVSRACRDQVPAVQVGDEGAKGLFQRGRSGGGGRFPGRSGRGGRGVRRRSGADAAVDCGGRFFQAPQ